MDYIAEYSDEKFFFLFQSTQNYIFKKTVDKFDFFYYESAKNGFFSYFFKDIFAPKSILSTKTLILTFPRSAPEIGANSPLEALQLK